MTTRGFTLIELLVVIAIIGVLSSVALASLNVARLKAADSTVKTETAQLRTIMNYEFNDTGSYANIKAPLGGSWLAVNGVQCPAFSGTYAAQASTLCNGLVKASGTACGGTCVWFYATSPDAPDKYTIMAYLPYASAQAGSARWFCMGSSGGNGISAGAWTESGCYGNP